MSPQMGRYTQQDANADIAAHAALIATHGCPTQILDIADLNTHIADLDAHIRNAQEVMRTGEYWLPAPGTEVLVAIAADNLYTSPIVVPRDITIDRITIEVTAPGAGGTRARLGIYRDGVNLYPGSLLLDAGEVAVDVNGIKPRVINQALTKGLYWFCLVSDGTPTISATGYLGGQPPWLRVYPTDFTHRSNCWVVGHAYAALPDPYTAGGAFSTYAYRILPRILSLD